jgi:hypothetical protein
MTIAMILRIQGSAVALGRNQHHEREGVTLVHRRSVPNQNIPGGAVAGYGSGGKNGGSTTGVIGQFAVSGIEFRPGWATAADEAAATVNATNESRTIPLRFIIPGPQSR